MGEASVIIHSVLTNSAEAFPRSCPGEKGSDRKTCIHNIILSILKNSHPALSMRKDFVGQRHRQQVSLVE